MRELATCLGPVVESSILASLAEKKKDKKKRCVKTFEALISENEGLPSRNEINPADKNKGKSNILHRSEKRTDFTADCCSCLVAQSCPTLSWLYGL